MSKIYEIGKLGIFCLSAAIAIQGCSSKPISEELVASNQAEPAEPEPRKKYLAPEPPAPILHPFLWKATKGGKSSFILGTIHAGVPMADLPYSVGEALNLSNAIAIECCDSSDMKKLSAEVESFFQPSSEPTAKSQISPESWRKFLAVVGKSVPEVALEKFDLKQAALIFAAMSTEKADFSQGSMDRDLVKYAAKSSTSLFYMESLQEFAELSKDSLLKFEMSPAEFEQLVSEDRSITELVDAYRSGNSKKIFDLMRDLSGEYHDLLIKKRNQAWVRKVKNFHSTHAPVFMAVGVGHLAAKDSLLEMLEKEGFRIQRIHQARGLK